MTHVKFTRRPAASLNRVVDELFADLPGFFKNDFPLTNRNESAPVNIVELENKFSVEVFAPGFEKHELSIRVEENLLTISGERKNDRPETKGKLIRQEYEPRRFKRSFTLSEAVDATRIDASYINGVLILNLPRKEPVKEPAKEIQIS
ncbi:MAG TPA: Hsp20/alpha crystallin family protein [Chitinophagaceae bacterium]|nr:Hsp20/alpha crystallin family protein [Chitinophagaceae bacterium]